MAIDAAPIGILAAEVMAMTEERFGPDAELAEVLVVVEVRVPLLEHELEDCPDCDSRTHVLWRSSTCARRDRARPRGVAEA